MNERLLGRPGLLKLVAMLATVGVFAAALAFAVMGGPPASRAAPLAMMTDFAGTTDHVEFAHYPEVFIGSITDEIGEHNISEAGAALMVPLFAGEVDRTIFGTASGLVNVAIYKDEFTAEMTADIVAVGGRYLFASDVPDGAGAYYAAEGFGVTAVRSEAAADGLEAEFRRMRAVEPALTAQNFPPADPCETLTVKPTIDVEPIMTKAGGELTVTIENVVRPEVGIFWRTFRHMIGRARVRKDCTAETVVRVPRNAKPGVYRVIVADARALRAVEMVEITGRGDRKVRERASEREPALSGWLTVVEPGAWTGLR